MGGMGLLALLVGTPGTATADILRAEQREGERGYVAVEELSFETIIEAGDGYSATLKVRTALHNSSLSVRDVVHSLGVPFASTLEGIAVMQEGTWQPGAGTTIAPARSRREPGTAFARILEPTIRTDNPGVELVAYGLEPDQTMQVELTLRIFPRLRGDNWELDLPARGVGSLALAPERRVLVKGLKKDEAFWVDEQSSGSSPFVLTRAEDTVTVAWPSHLASSRALEVNAEVEPGPAGFDDGALRLYLRLGEDAPLRPDHVLFVIDHSKSTPGSLDANVLAMANGVLDALPARTTFDAIAFNRTVTPLFAERGSYGKAGVAGDRVALADALQAHPRGQGTDLETALAEAARLAKDGRGKTLIIVATDGMFPSRVAPTDVGNAFDQALGGRKKRPEVVFVVDEPLLQRGGMSVRHPAAEVAAVLGARISLESVEQLGGARARSLLSTPKVLSQLQVDLPQGVTLDDPLPEGLVAGSFVMLRGHYVGKPPKNIKVVGRFGPKEVARKVEPDLRTPAPEAFAAATTSPQDRAVLEGYSAPPWYQPGHAREARSSIAQAGRFGRHKKKGFLDQKVFRHYLTTRVLPRARACYNDSLTRNPELSGRVVLEIEVGKGEVMNAQVAEDDLDQKDAKLEACLAEAAWRLDAPAGVRDAQIYRLRYPLRLNPPEPGKVGGSVTTLSDEVMELLLSQPTPAG